MDQGPLLSRISNLFLVVAEHSMPLHPRPYISRSEMVQDKAGKQRVRGEARQGGLVMVMVMVVVFQLQYLARRSGRK